MIHNEIHKMDTRNRPGIKDKSHETFLGKGAKSCISLFFCRDCDFFSSLRVRDRVEELVNSVHELGMIRSKIDCYTKNIVHKFAHI
jgi:hypothetical protein